MILLGLIHAESAFNPDVVSSAGAVGLTQFMPDTIRWLGMTVKEFQSCLACQVDLAARYLAELTQRYGGRTNLALLAYNGNLTPSQAHYVLRVSGLVR